MDAVYDGILGAVALKQCLTARYGPSPQVGVGRYSGGLDPQEFYLTGANPGFSWETKDIAGVLAGVSVTTGLAVAAGTVSMPFQKRAQGGTFSGAGANAIITSANGLAVISAISASDGDATVSLDYMGRSTDGVTVPITASVNQNLSAQAFNVTHCLRKVLINGTTLTQVRNVVVRPGITVTPFTAGGHLYPTIFNITQRNPTIDITFCDLDGVSTYGPLFAAMTSAVVYLAKRSDGGTFVADGTGAHVSLSFAAGIITPESVQGQDPNSELTLRLYGKALTSSVTATIP